MKEKFDFRSIKTINDACEKAGIDFNAFMAIIDPLPEHLRALAAMEVIIKALNDGWENPLDGETWCYYPWIYVYDNIEMAEVLRETPGREDLIRFKRPDGNCGLACATSDFALLARTVRPACIWCKTSRISWPCTTCRWKAAMSSRGTSDDAEFPFPECGPAGCAPENSSPAQGARETA